MRVECKRVEDFLLNLAVAKGSHVFGNMVFVDVSKVPLGEDRRNAVVFDVVLQAAAVVVMPEGEDQFLLVLGLDCGRDYEDNVKEGMGTEVAERAKRELESYCNAHGLVVGAGTVQE